jgi:hypothetical protein
MQDNVREATREYVAKHGTPIRWLARKLSCSDSHIIHWLKGDRELGQERLSLLREIVCQ